jgi:hypothetical protein
VLHPHSASLAVSKCMSENYVVHACERSRSSKILGLPEWCNTKRDYVNPEYGAIPRASQYEALSSVAEAVRLLEPQYHPLLKMKSDLTYLEPLNLM